MTDPNTKPLTLPFSGLNKSSLPIAGGKGANLGEMFNAGIPVPDGFVVTADAYYYFLDKSSLRHKIQTELENLDIQNSESLNSAAENIKNAILSAEMPSEIKDSIISSYHTLCGNDDHYVAVRSSATAEDLPDASFAGQQDTFLNIKGADEVVRHVQKCWASLFGARAIYYRQEQNFDHFKVGIAVPIQLMIQSEVSGIMFTVNPLTNNTEEISIEAVFGLGDAIVSGELTPDQYLISKGDFNIKNKHVVKQEWQDTMSGHIDVSMEYKDKQKLDDSKIVELAKIGAKIEEHYAKPQDIEWAMQNNTLYIVQSRPVTTLKIKTEDITVDIGNADMLLTGLSASPGVGVGFVKILVSAKEIGKIQKGDILVTPMTDPDFVPAMRKAAAIVTDNGGRTSHAAIVSRELGIPCVVGTGSATEVLKEGDVITVNGYKGAVYSGDKSEQFKQKEENYEHKNDKTATNLYVNLGEPDLAQEIAKRNVDGIGLLRAEFMIANIGKHPRAFIEEGKQEEFTTKLEEGLLMFAQSFNPRQVVYRATDFKTNEYRSLEGGDKFEEEEQNPMLGFRGVSRYISDPEVFAMELEAIKRVRNKHGFKNLQLMLPFVRTVEQLMEAKKIVNSHGLSRSADFKLWMMAEIPSNVILLDDFIKVGIDGVSIGSNDLTMLTLGVDRDNAKVADVYNEMNPAVLQSLEKIITTCVKNNITCSICGQAPSVYPELTEMLVSWGVTSISVSPDVIDRTRHLIYLAEQKKHS
ncbi:phosphoenolpyruvate synthase [candidate division WWE3 bacterium CG10_big_fil_rev_8_21_14_0_10_32_10]|uniref:Phosphoenolpyruvate synthase n=1 Tax=candidate division WWE3 bacterium CG10_big_fil_rev_8_21_14_0_10_32_10 TaxID=1975090 RepID=A0A2H0RAU1_UNCKA|nr:MAG: phosphoenolpyruvate synthase [candidate division WWE3 bacterium CG10_big_fil_rev_8_21_14_0_10_32_10]